MKWNKIYRDIKGMLEKGLVKKNYNLKNNNTYRVDCCAKILVEINSIETFCKTIKYCEANNIPKVVLGRGSNVLFVTEKLNAIVILLGDKFSNIYMMDDAIIAESGAMLTDVAVFARNNSYTGMEESAGIPGSVGGAVVMNASAYGYETANVVSSVLMYHNGKIEVRDSKDMHFGYRSSCIQGSDDIVLRVEFRLECGDKGMIEGLMRETIAKRCARKCSTYPNAGSVFKNGNNYYAGELIDKCGLKNYNIGNAFVSSNHANFIENRGSARGDDIYALIKYVHNSVREKFDIEMELEQKIIGDNG